MTNVSRIRASRGNFDECFEDLAMRAHFFETFVKIKCPKLEDRRNAASARPRPDVGQTSARRRSGAGKTVDFAKKHCILHGFKANI